jgi:4'-phosphopantetheinyl transferase
MQTTWSTPAESIALSADWLDVWAVQLDGIQARIDELTGTLAPNERQRAQQYRVEEPRRRFIVARAALRQVLGGYLGAPASGIALESAPSGKPRLAGLSDTGGIRFNVAHSGGLVLIAVTRDCEVGIDVERIRFVNFAEHIARRYFHPVEAEAILAAPATVREAAFLRCWTGKEAVLKALGRGITGSLTTFLAPTSPFGSVAVELPLELSGEHSHCKLYELEPGSDYVAAVACLGAERDVRCFNFDMSVQRSAG